MKPAIIFLRAPITAFVMALAACVATAPAATLTWDADGTPTPTDGAGAWLGANQWWNGTSTATWTSGDDAVFGVGGTGGAVTLSATTAAKSLTFNAFTGTYTLGTSGTTLTLGGGGITMNADAGAVTLASPVTLGTAQSWTNNSASLLTASAAITNGGFGLTVAGSGNTTLAGVISGTGGLTKTGGGTLTLAGTNSYAGTTTVSAGTLALSGGRSGTMAQVTVANVAGTNATLAIQSGSYGLGANSFIVGNVATSVGTVNQTSGLVTFTTGGVAQLALGVGTGAVGVYNLSSGTIRTAASTSRGINLGLSPNSSGTFTMSGGALNMTAASGGGTGDATLQIGRYDQSGENGQSGAFLQSGGVANVGILSIGGNGSNAGTGGTQVLTLTGGTFAANQFPRLSAGNSNVATITIGGSADVTLPAFPTGRGSAATATVYFDGGVLRPAATSTSYMTGLTNAFIRSGGVTFDVPSGRDITVGQALLADGTSPGGGLAKTGAGTLTLSGSNAYSGATTISAGILSIGGTSGLAGTSSVTIAGGAGLRYTGGAATFSKNVTVTSGTGTVENIGGGLLTLSGSLSKDNSVLRLAGGAFNVTGTISGTTVGKSDLVVAGTSSVTLSAANTYNGPTFVIESSTLALGASNAIPNSSVVTLGDATTRGTLVIGGYTDAIAQLVFSGSGGTLSLNGNSTAGVLLSTTSSLTLGSNASLVLTNAGTSAGLYRLISYTSLSGSFSPSNVTGVPIGYSLLYTGTEVDLQQNAVFGTISVTNPSAIITGGSAAFSYTVSNAALSGGATLSVTGTGVSNVAGTSSGSALAGGTSSAISGLFFTGATTGTGQTGMFNVTGAGTTQTGTVSVNVYGHATGSATGATIALADSIVGYTGSLLGLTSATISNASGYRVDLMTTGGTSAGFVNINNVSGVAAGSSALISAAALLTGTQAVGTNSLGQSFNLTYADNSALAGASSNLGSQTITVTGNVLDHATPGFLATGITDPYNQNVLSINFGSIDETAGPQNFVYNLLNLASQTYGAELTAGLDFTGVTADGNGFASGLSTFNNLVGGGTSSQFTLTFTPSGQGTFSQSFTLSFYDNQNIAGAAARRDLTINASIIVVPEPGAIALAAIGVAAAAWTLRKRRRLP